MGIASRELQHCNAATVRAEPLQRHFDHQVKEARLSYAERQQSSTKSTLQCCERKLSQKNEKFLVKYS